MSGLRKLRQKEIAPEGKYAERMDLVLGRDNVVVEVPVWADVPPPSPPEPDLTEERLVKIETRLAALEKLAGVKVEGEK